MFVSHDIVDKLRPTDISSISRTRKRIERIALSTKGAQRLTLACSNIKIILYITDDSRTERRCTLIAHKLVQLNMDIADLSEVRFSEESNLHEQRAG